MSERPERCSVCGAQRVREGPGLWGACSLVPGRDGKGGCPDPLFDVRRERHEESPPPASPPPAATASAPDDGPDEGENVCADCGEPYDLRDGEDPTDLCDHCAHEAVAALRAEVARLTAALLTVARTLESAEEALGTHPDAALCRRRAKEARAALASVEKP